MKLRVATGVFWLTCAGALQAASPVRDILRPEAAASLNALWSLAEGYSPPPDGKSSFTGGGSHAPKSKPQRPVLRRQTTPTGNAVCEIITRKKAEPAPQPHSAVQSTAEKSIHPPGKQNLSNWLSHLSDVVHVMIRETQKRREAGKTRRLLALSSGALFNYISLLPVKRLPVISGARDEESYASGIMAGASLMSREDALRRSGIKHDSSLFLAGISDVFHRQMRLQGPQLENAQRRVVAQLNQAEVAERARQISMEKRFVADFRQRRGVRAGGKGIWFRVDLPGRREGLTRQAVIPLVAREMLADGTVIQDMQADGKILNTTLSKLPPAWREAVQQAGFGGRVTVVQSRDADGRMPTRVSMIRTFDPRNYLTPGRPASLVR